jgi:hypothetical protein
MDLVDDATSTTLSRMGAEETIWAAAGVLRKWIESYGVPKALYTIGKTSMYANRLVRSCSAAKSR